jgi:hypothetical protein
MAVSVARPAVRERISPALTIVRDEAPDVVTSLPFQSSGKIVRPISSMARAKKTYVQVDREATRKVSTKIPGLSF